MNADGSLSEHHATSFRDIETLIVRVFQSGGDHRYIKYVRWKRPVKGTATCRCQPIIIFATSFRLLLKHTQHKVYTLHLYLHTIDYARSFHVLCQVIVSSHPFS